MLDICLSGHVISNRQKPILFLSNDLESLPNVNSNLFIDIGCILVLFQQFYQFHNNRCVNFMVFTINALFLASQVNGCKHDQRYFICHFNDIVRLKKFFCELDHLLIYTLLFPFQIHCNITQGAQ